MITALLGLIQRHYDSGLDDYWLPPLIKSVPDEGPVGRVSDGDVLIFACRRGEREIQLTEAFVDPEFTRFQRKFMPDLGFFPMVEYHSKFTGLPALFPAVRPPHPLGEVLSRNGLSQLRIAESEKFSHVTYYFNGRREQPHPGEEWISIPSVTSSTELHPAMRSVEIVEALIRSLDEKDYRFAVANLAAGDIFGHIPDFQAQVRCVEMIDQAVGIVADFCQRSGCCLILTADHGLLEQAYLPDGSWSLGHTRASVPFVLADPMLKGRQGALASGGSLADVAPTILKLMGFDPPGIMTGRPLIKQYVCMVDRIVLLILDGFGQGEENPRNNPIYAAETPNLDQLFRLFPHTRLQASGAAVGLAPNSSGNSETGHLTLGSGRVIIQDEVRIPAGITPDQLQRNRAFYRRIKSLPPSRGVHILFLLSPGSSHGSLDEALKLLAVLKEWGAPKVYLHAISDGRSAPRRGAVDLLLQLQEALDRLGIGEVVTVCGRGYALDRSGHYRERTKLAYEALVDGRGLGWYERL